MLGRDDHGFVDISAIALNAAISESILGGPEASLIALPLESAAAVRACLLRAEADYCT
jgi:hypothetical protein